MKTYGLYEYRRCGTWEGTSHDSTHLLGTGKDPSDLRDRWNSDVIDKHNAVANEHESSRRYLPKEMEEDALEVRYPGSTGGGYHSVEYRVYIKEIPQFDEK